VGSAKHKPAKFGAKTIGYDTMYRTLSAIKKTIFEDFDISKGKSKLFYSFFEFL